MPNDHETLLALAERCEKAEGSDRELDGLIAVAVKAVDPRTKPSGLQGFGYVDRNQWACSHVSPYTASIDAALTLVPGGMDWFRERGAYVPFIATVDGPICRFFAETDNSFALALCAAALRARAEGTSHDH